MGLKIVIMMKKYKELKNIKKNVETWKRIAVNKIGEEKNCL